MDAVERDSLRLGSRYDRYVEPLSHLIDIFNRESQANDQVYHIRFVLDSSTAFIL